jgi:tRNA threonylcarbamoyladenosine biosynthesis protein TsaE
MKKIYGINSLSTLETETVGARLAAALEKKNIKRAFIAMRGEMGVGKTAFTRGFAGHFGIKGVKSPTYTVLNEYRGRAFVYHFDMYRILSEDDLISIGYDDYVQTDGYVIAEWSENAEKLLPSERITVEIKRRDDSEGEREIIIDLSQIEALTGEDI